MAYLLNAVYLLLLAAAAPVLAWKSLRTGKYRRGFAAKFLGRVPVRASNAPGVWLHAVSVGEVNLLGTILAELRLRHPDWEFVISTTTATGFALAQQKYPQHTVFYCPLDFTWAVKHAMRRVRPAWLLLAELELWPNLINEAKAQGARVAVINGRLSDKSFRGYRRIRSLLAPLLGKLDLIAVQSPQYAERFLALGAPASAVQLTGSIKFDGAQTDRANPATVGLRKLAMIADSDVVFLAGSTQEPEEELALAAFRELAPRYPQLRLILVPRHPERFATVADLLEKCSLPWQRRSDLAGSTVRTEARILLVDRVGELGAWWGLTQIAYVGGSMGPREGQNMIEPAAYGAAVSFGPRTRNFRDVVALLREQEAAVVVRSVGELTAFVARCLAQPDFADRLGTRAQSIVRGQLGATAKTCDWLDAITQGSKRLEAQGRNAA